MDVKGLLNWTGDMLSEAHRGVLPQNGKLVVFGNRGRHEVEEFEGWLRKHKYKVEDYAAENESWVMVVAPPAKMRDTRAVAEALWETSPDDPARKAVQSLIASLHIRLVFARQCVTLERDYFTRAEARGLMVFLPFPVADLGIPDGQERSRRFEPSTN